MSRVKFVCAVVLAIFALGIGTSATGAAPRSGKGPGGGGNPGAALQFSSNPVVVGSTYDISGSGFSANTWVTVGAHAGADVYWYPVKTDAAGRFTIAASARVVGSSLHEAKERANNGSYRLKTSATLTVVSG